MCLIFLGYSLIHSHYQPHMTVLMKFAFKLCEECHILVTGAPGKRIGKL
jgi:hypothetical protein